MSSARQHNSGPEPDGQEVPEPTHAERARTLVHLQKIGTLSTLSRRQPGWPFGSIMPYAIDEQGRPSFLISAMAMHTQNLVNDERASLLVMPAEISGDPLGAARVTLMGPTTKVAKEEVVEVRERYLSRHATASYWVDFNDFAFFRMTVSDVYFVGGFGSMGWVAAEEYAAAEVDPLADVAADLMREINQHQADTLALLARVCGQVEVEQATMTALDRLGFHVRIKSPDRMRGGRVAFTQPVRSVQEVNAELDAIAAKARQGVPVLHSI